LWNKPKRDRDLFWDQSKRDQPGHKTFGDEMERIAGGKGEVVSMGSAVRKLINDDYPIYF
jgi:hypothetical protein